MRSLVARMPPVLQFALSGVLATVLIGLAVAAVSRETGTDEAIRDAKQLTRIAGEGIVEPHVDDALLAGDPAALRRMDRVVRARVLSQGIDRVKLWTSDGRVVYSDERRLVGHRYALDREERDAIEHNLVEAEVSDLRGPENRFERAEDKKLLEVYLPIHAPDGRPLLFEVYQPYRAVVESGGRLWLAFAPALLGGLLLLQLVSLSLARSLARRLREGQRQREALLERALGASETERRTIAADLHDGVVQDLVAASYNLTAEADRLGADGDGDGTAGMALRRGATAARDSVRALRTLLVDIYPPSLHHAGLEVALGDLARTYTARGLETTVDLPEDGLYSDVTERLLFRCAQEALRNAQKHAGAAHAWVTVRDTDHGVTLEVRDDGRGFDPALVAERRQAGHFGLSMLGDLVGDVGGHLDLRSQPGLGTTVAVELPR